MNLARLFSSLTARCERAVPPRVALFAALVIAFSGLGSLGLSLHPVRAWAQPAQELQSVRRVPAHSLDGGGDWINAAGPIGLPQLRGKFVILDFWTYCCINCLQTLPELKRLEQAYPRELVVIGVHSPKFFNERDTDNIREAVVRYSVDHPVVNDANLVIAKKYGVVGWPSLRVIDPQGYLIASHYGEATFEMLDRFLRRAMARYRRSGAVDETPLRFDLDRYTAEPTPLRFPGKILVDGTNKRMFIADSGHHRIVIATMEGKLLDTVGRGAVGRQDGAYDQATFSSPQGMALDGDTLFVADTENHLLRTIDLRAKKVATVAGTGEQRRKFTVRAAGRPLGNQLASPWDLWLHEGELYIAMAGNHQIWRMTLRPPRIQPFAGSGTEDIIDGRLLPRLPFEKSYAAFAQPSGLTVDGQWLYVADSEGSSIRAIPLQGRGNVTTLLGTAKLPTARLFTFGDRDGPLDQALLQHPLAVAHQGGLLYVADTYNNKIKQIDLKKSVITTIAGDQQPGREDSPARFNEPAGLSLADGALYVADTNNHLVRVIDLEKNFLVRTLEIKGLKPPELPTSDSAPELPGTKKITFGTVDVKPTGKTMRVAVRLEFPAGYIINGEAPMSYVATIVDGDKLLASSANGQRVIVSEPANQFEIALPVSRLGSATLKISLVYFYCHKDSVALCKAGGVDWTGEVKLTQSASASQIDLKYAVR
jgi:thiol-disulfide isomerase/thioredoxin/sugar lactone lactonase YvrE